jgi:ABC-type branched-subunit amino acid transport system substrate-binding protein
MKKRKSPVIILVLFLFLVAPIVNTSGENNAKDPPIDVDIAFLLDQTGPISVYADAFQAAAYIAIDHLNDKQDDYTFQVYFYDTGCDGATAAAAAQDIVDSGINLVVGALCSFASMNANDVLDIYDIPQISPTSTSPELSNATAYPDFFRVVPSDALQGQALNAVVAADMPADGTVALVHMMNDYGSGIANSFADAYAESNNTLCTQIGYEEWNNPDYDTIVQYVMDDGCTSVVLASYAADGAMIIDEMALQEFTGQIYAGDGICDASMYDEVSDNSLLDGIICTQPQYSQPSTTRALEFSADCYGDCAAGIYTAETYDAFSIMMESYILTQLEDIDLVDAIHFIGYEWEGASSNITFNEDGDVAGQGHGICEFNSSNSSLDCPIIYVSDSFNFIPDNELYGYDVFTLMDTDEDGIADIFDDFPNDACADTDTDQDGSPDIILPNCTTTLEEDIDDDNDGVYDIEDAFPLDPSESLDYDGDGIGDLTDNDDDNDGFTDDIDAFPLDSTENMDTDGDNIGDNADTDDDNDLISDEAEITLGTDPLDSDTDDDGFTDDIDALPLDSTENMDTDGDNIGDNADTDDDGDGVSDIDDAFPLDSTENMDTDGDNIGDNADTDDDGDGVSDIDDAFPLDSTENMDTDGDNIGDNADTDDDNDLISDEAEITLGTDPLDSDTDDDGFLDSADDYPLDAGKYSASVEAENAGLPGFGIFLPLISMFIASIAISRKRNSDGQ